MSKATPRINTSLLIVSLIIFSVMLPGCQTHRTSSDVLLLSYGMQLGKVSTETYQHLIISHKLPAGSQSLHVYIEGDGSPWIRRTRIALDPTPHRPMALQLMTRDLQADTLYLGRPCYYNQPRYGLADSHCQAELWTSDRYSRAVINSMMQALQQAAALANYDEIVLIGYSGGGTLAMLIAEQLTGSIKLITLGANLDTDAWTTHHSYTPLFGSLNPAKEITQSDVPQIHWVGSDDKTVPSMLNTSFLSRLNQPQKIIANFDHACCWLEAWPELLMTSLDSLKTQEQAKTEKEGR